MKDVTIDHPQFKGIAPLGSSGAIVVLFEIGYWAKPTAEVIEAYDRVKAIIRTVAEEDLKLIRQFGGGLSLHGISSNLVNPETTDEMMEEFKALSMAAFPSRPFSDMWRNQSNGTTGVSVRLLAPQAKG